MANFVQHVKVTRGPLASVYYCPFCEAPDSRSTVKHQRPGSGPGRGFGFAASSKARAAVTAHIKAKHPERG